ncbi:helix-turn-helix transcriptional regulator [Iamia sp. SCSIO 61187]|nr:helix-turn-helix transcriptional regulator [Iamia sp. SCSIO 61187]
MTILGTKLHPPRRRPTLVGRPRLEAATSRSAHSALTLVSAPAGFGKTTLVADRWGEGPSTAWLSLDRGDDDLVRFWTYVVAALATAAPDLSDDATGLLGAPGTPIEAVVATLINDLETVASEVVLVLDDYHVIEQVEIHDSVAFLFEHLPVQVRVVIATRSDPPLPLAAMRARGELLEIRAADLRFTADEAASYLNGAMDLALGADDIEVLGARTEGWIAALQLAALSLQGGRDPTAFIAEFAGDDRFILDYLADEVLERQTPEIRRFLLETSILSRLTGPLCGAVTGLDGAKATLDGLDRANLFVVPLDDRRTWYRYHHLFGDVLRARLVDEDPGRVPELHRRASDWYAAHDEPHEAIAHALAGGRFDRAAALIERTAPAMQRARQEAVLRRWLEALPREVYADRPVLTVFLVGARMATGEATGCDELLDRAEARLIRSDPPLVESEVERRRLPAMVAVHRAGLALLAGDLDGTVRHARRVLDLASDDDPLQRGAGSALLGLAHWSRGDLDTARQRYVESVACFEAGRFLPDVMGCSIALADIQTTQGRLHDAQRTFASALRHTADEPGLRGAADMHVGLSLLALERDDLVAAAQHLDASAELGEHRGLPQHPYRWRVAAALLHHAHGDDDAALELLTEAERLYDTDYSPRVRPVSAITTRVRIARGDVAAGERWAAAHGLSATDEPTYLRELEHITLARLLLARGTIDAAEEAVGLLGRLLTAAEQGDRGGSSIEILVLLAVAHRAAGRRDEAVGPMEVALARAEPEGYVRTFLDAGSGAIDVLRSLDGTSGRRAARLLAGATSAVTPARRRSAGPDELSEREVDVLRLLRSDLSGPDIARELHVSLNTLRTHTRHIYTKLGATNRREAVSRAASLGL